MNNLAEILFEEGFKIGTPIDTRLVGIGPKERHEWRLVISDDAGGTTWVPYRINLETGLETIPAWMSLPGSQTTFLKCPIFEAIYEGTRGPGKTLTLLMDFLADVNQGWGSAWRGVLFRKQFGDLDDVVLKIEEWFPKIQPGFRFLRSKSEYRAEWPTGEALLLRHMKDENDYSEYHGHEYPWIGWEELTEWADDKAYKLMFSCSRPIKQGIRCRVRSTCNPYGVGHNWVKKRFKLPSHRHKVIRIPGELPRVSVHGALYENFLLEHADPTYRTKIRQAAKNLAQREAWEKADWDITSGGMIDDLWNPEIHVLPTFPVMSIPRGWTITRSYDHGQSSPFSVGWWLESNGEPVMHDNRLIGNVRGDLILWAEWYGTTGNENEGLRMSARKIAQGIKDREHDFGIEGRVQPGPADTEIYNKRHDTDGYSPADDMEKVGIYWEWADKSQGSRKRGWEMFRTFLENAIPNRDGSREKPGLFICDRCRHWLDLCPPLPRDEQDPDDVPKKYEDHAADMTRYRVSWELPTMWRRSF